MLKLFAIIFNFAENVKSCSKVLLKWGKAKFDRKRIFENFIVPSFLVIQYRTSNYLSSLPKTEDLNLPNLPSPEPLEPS